MGGARGVSGEARLVDLARRQVVVARERDADEALVVAEVEVAYRKVPRSLSSRGSGLAEPRCWSGQGRPRRRRRARTPEGAAAGAGGGREGIGGGVWRSRVERAGAERRGEERGERVAEKGERQGGGRGEGRGEGRGGSERRVGSGESGERRVATGGSERRLAYVFGPTRLAVLKGRHGAGVDVKIGVDLDGGDAVARLAQEHP